jgi:hypothetical protein
LTIVQVEYALAARAPLELFDRCRDRRNAALRFERLVALQELPAEGRLAVSDGSLPAKPQSADNGVEAGEAHRVVASGSAISQTAFQ